MVFYLWTSVSIKVGRTLQVTIKEDQQLAKLSHLIAKHYEHQTVTLPSVSRLFAKAISSLRLYPRSFRVLEKLFGWEKLVPSDVAFESLQQFKMIDVATLKRQAHEATAQPEVAEVIETAAPAINRSWESYHFDYSKLVKLIGLHTSGSFGLYLLLTAEVHPNTIVLALLMYSLCGATSSHWLTQFKNHYLQALASLAATIVSGLTRATSARRLCRFSWPGSAAGPEKVSCPNIPVKPLKPFQTGSILWWSRDHRLHHKFGDSESDPYPIVHGFWFGASIVLPP